MAVHREQVTEDPGHLLCPEGWHVDQVLLIQQHEVAEVPGLLGLGRRPGRVQRSSLEWHESSENLMAREQKVPQLRLRACSSCTGSTLLWWVMNINGSTAA